jgi:hypothetical protein
MNFFKNFVTIFIFIAGSTANATIYNITGTQNSTTPSAPGVLSVQNAVPFGVLPTSFPINAAISLTGSLDITGTTINSGSFTVADYGAFASFSGENLNSYIVQDWFGSGANFTGSGVGFVATGTSGSCIGPAQFPYCQAGPGLTEFGYILTATGPASWDLKLITISQSSSTLTKDYSLVGAVPIPAASWLFGSGLIGLVGAVRKRKSV